MPHKDWRVGVKPWDLDNADDLYWWYVTFTLDTIALNDYD